MRRLSLTALAAIGLLTAGAAPAFAAEGGEGGTVMIMKHACTEQDVQSEADFKAIEAQAKGDRIVALALTVLACPTTVLPDDAEGQIGAVKNEPREFDFTITDADGNEFTLEDAEFMPQKVSEADVQRDLNGDGEFSKEVSLDTSHYKFTGLAVGEVKIHETSEPEGFRFGTFRLTPPELQKGSDDQATGAEITGNAMITADLSGDPDNQVMLHIYNFEGEMPDTATAPVGTDAPASAPVALLGLFGLTGALAAAYVMRRRIA